MNNSDGTLRTAGLEEDRLDLDCHGKIATLSGFQTLMKQKGEGPLIPLLHMKMGGAMVPPPTGSEAERSVSQSAGRF